MTILQILYLSAFIFAISVDWLIKSKFLGNQVYFYYLRFVELPFITIVFIFFSVFLLLLLLLSYFDISLFFIFEDAPHSKFDYHRFMIEGGGSSEITDNTITSSGQSSGQSSTTPSSAQSNNTVNLNSRVEGQVGQATVNLNTPRFNISMSLKREGVNNLAAAASSAGGAGIGLKVAKYVGGPPMLKLGAGLGTMLAVQGTSTIMSKILNANNKEDGNKYISDLLSNTDSKILNDKYTEFPLNLLPEMNTLVNVQLLFIIILLNIFIVNILTTIDYSKYIPNNKLGKLLLFIIERYIKLWGKSKKFLMIISYLNLFLCIIILKICFYYIIN